ncbi:MAG: HDOD domain-containing protein [Gemmatimonadales bacterium]|nr:HDOD domain-containing protein [Gemmatimonadales bacterium]
MTQTIDCTDLVHKKIKELPPLPLVIQKLTEVMENPSSSADHVKEILSSDQALAGKVLKLVNSSFYGLSGEVSTISRAVVILGFSAVRNLATGLGVVKLMGKPSTDQIVKDFWRHSVSTGAAAYVLAQHTDYADPEEAFIAGLLHDLGGLILILAVPKEYQEVMDLGPDNMIENEQKLLGITHARVGQKVLKHWKLPKNLCDAVRYHHTPKIFNGKEDPLVSIVALADTLSCAHGMLYERSLTNEDFPKLIQVTGLDVSEVGDILKEMDDRVCATRNLLKLGDEIMIQQTTSGQETPRSVVLLCTSPTQATWGQQILNHYGHNLIPMKKFFSSPDEHEEVDLVLVDPESVSAEQLAKMKPVLEKFSGKIAVLGEDPEDVVRDVLGHAVRSIPLAFSRCDLENQDSG